MKPCASIVTMSPVSYQPSSRRLQHAGTVGLEIAHHDIGAAHQQSAASVDAGHRFELVLDARHQPPDRAEFVEHRRVERQHRRRLGDAVAFENADAEFLAPDRRASTSSPARRRRRHSGSNGSRRRGRCAHSRRGMCRCRRRSSRWCRRPVPARCGNAAATDRNRPARRRSSGSMKPIVRPKQ